MIVLYSLHCEAMPKYLCFICGYNLCTSYTSEVNREHQPEGATL